MKIGLLKTDEIPSVLQDKHGDFNSMFQKNANPNRLQL